MDDLDSGNSGNEELDKPIPFDDNDPDKPISLDDIEDDDDETFISHSPLNLGNGRIAATQTNHIKPAEKKPYKKLISLPNRITGIKTFFTKLHPGAINFLDEQITEWLKKNPGVTIKRTNTVTGPVQAKKTEPNIIINVWY